MSVRPRITYLQGLSALLVACGGGGVPEAAAPTVTLTQERLYEVGTLPPDHEIVFVDHFETNNVGTNGQQLWTYREGPRVLDGFTGYNRADNVQVQDGVLKINFTQEADQFIGGGIISSQNFGYGYYEAKIRFYTGTAGLHQSFWTYSTTEIDAVEMKSDDGKLTNNLHKWVPNDPSLHRSNPSSGKTKLPVGPGTFLSDWVHVGALYEEGKVTFFTNGVIDRSIDKASFPSFPTYDVGKIWLTALPTKAITPMANARMEVDWVYYARSRTDTLKNLVSNKDFSIHAPVSITGSPHTSILGWSTGSAGGQVPNVADPNYSRLHRNTVFADKGITPASTQWLLEHRNRHPQAAPWNTNTFQSIPYPANGKYYARIRYKSSTQNPESYASQLILRDDKNEVLKLVLEDNTNGLWVDRYIGLQDDSINLQNASPKLNLIIHSAGHDLSDQLWVDFVGLYKKSN